MPATEAQLQEAVAADLRDRMVRHRDLLAIHVPNEGRRTAKQGRSLKAQGMVSGAPDLVIWLHTAYMAQGWPPCVSVELKASAGSVSANQAAFGQRLAALGHRWHVVVAGTVDEAVARVRSLLPAPSVAVVNLGVAPNV